MTSLLSIAPPRIRIRTAGCENTIGRLSLERLFSKLSSAGLVPLSLSWASPDGAPDQNRVIEAMMRASAARFENVESYSRLQHYSASDARFGMKAEMLVRIN